MALTAAKSERSVRKMVVFTTSAKVSPAGLRHQRDLPGGKEEITHLNGVGIGPQRSRGVGRSDNLLHKRKTPFCQG